MNSEYSRFSTSSGVTEHFFAMTSKPGSNFSEEASRLLADFQIKSAGTVLVWLRFHLSDIGNQAELLRSMVQSEPAMVGQPPANGSRIALEAYALSGDCLPEIRYYECCTELRYKFYKQFFFHAPCLTGKGSGQQMHEELVFAEDFLHKHGGCVAENLQRTWIYCRDIDNNYADLVTARRELFCKYGLTQDTHYIASTGIEGMSEEYNRLVRMDSFALFGHKPEQIEFMNALDHLSPTHIYGVTFERGTRIVYGDRSHYFISGTASIDAAGQIVHPGNVLMQTERLLENVEALLCHHGGTLQDLKQAVVYLRDTADREIVESVLRKRLSPDTARIMVRGAVCRPGWLVEMDAIAVNSSGAPQFGALRGTGAR